MQAIKKLEDRFNNALAKLDTGADLDTKVKENAELSKQVKSLETVHADKDAEIKKLRESVMHLTESEAKAAKQAVDLQKGGAGAEKTITDLQSKLAQVQTDNKAVLGQVDDLQSKLKDIENRPPTAENVPDDAEEVTELKQMLEASEAKRKNHFKKISHLRTTLIKLRAGVKDKVVDAQDINSTMQAELEALQTQMEALHTQRETDLTEVNAILEKLTPLVEGK